MLPRTPATSTYCKRLSYDEGMLPTNRSSRLAALLVRYQGRRRRYTVHVLDNSKCAHGRRLVNRLLRALVCCGTLLLAVPGHAENWPARPVRLIVPTGPGAATDVMARILADGLSRSLAQPVIVDNMPGASGIVAHQSVARAAADGYTLLFTSTSGMAINLISFKQLPYDPTRDFTPVAMVCSLGPQMLSVNADLPIRNPAEFVAYARANRGKLSIAFDTTAGAAAFAAKLINKRGDLGLVEVPYRSAAQMTQDVASGVDQVMVSSIVTASAAVEAGKVRPIAVMSAARFPARPDLPPINDVLPDIDVNGWFAVVAPAGMAPAVVAKLNLGIAAVLKGADIQHKLLLFGLATEGAGTPNSTGQFIRQEQERWRALGKELGVEPQ
jgi:tripartite-type tricarboxylate transporter receptor subunit TctC